MNNHRLVSAGLVVLLAMAAGCGTRKPVAHGPAPSAHTSTTASAAPGSGPAVGGSQPPPVVRAAGPAPQTPPQPTWPGLLRAAAAAPAAAQVAVRPSGGPVPLPMSTSRATPGSCRLAAGAPAPAATPPTPTSSVFAAGNGRWVVAAGGELEVGSEASLVRRLPSPGGTLTGISPDGLWAVLTDNSPSHGPAAGVFLVPLISGRPVWLPQVTDAAWSPSGNRLLVIGGNNCAFVFNPAAGRTAAAVANPAPSAGPYFTWWLAKGWYGADPVVGDRLATHDSAYLLWKPAAGTLTALGDFDTAATVDPAWGILAAFPGPCAERIDPTTGRESPLPCVGRKRDDYFSAAPVFSSSLPWYTVPYLPGLPPGPATTAQMQAINQVWLEPADGTRGWVFQRTALPRWSPGGRRLALATLAAGGIDLSVVACTPTECAAPQHVGGMPTVGATVEALDWSPDGRTLVTVVNAGSSGAGGVWSLPAAGGAPRDVLTLPPSASAHLFRLSAGLLVSWRTGAAPVRAAFLPDGGGPPEIIPLNA